VPLFPGLKKLWNDPNFWRDVWSRVISTIIAAAILGLVTLLYAKFVGMVALVKGAIGALNVTETMLRWWRDWHLGGRLLLVLILVLLFLLARWFWRYAWQDIGSEATEDPEREN
jgi:hypothetical protein